MGVCGIYFSLLCFFLAYASSGVCQAPSVWDVLVTLGPSLLLGPGASARCPRWREARPWLTQPPATPWPCISQSNTLQRRLREIVSLPSQANSVCKHSNLYFLIFSRKRCIFFCFFWRQLLTNVSVLTKDKQCYIVDELKFRLKY